jgi:hypothetical protein
MPIIAERVCVAGVVWVGTLCVEDECLWNQGDVIMMSQCIDVCPGGL